MARRTRRGSTHNYAVAPKEPRAFLGVEQKYLLCPASGHLHPPQARPLYPTDKRGHPTFVCGCGARAYLSLGFELETMGLTAAMLQARGIATEVGVFDLEPAPGGGPRYATCPASYFLHAGLHAVVVQHGKSVFHCQCSCGTNFFLGRHVPPLRPRPWTARHGYTVDQLKALGATADG